MRWQKFDQMDGTVVVIAKKITEVTEDVYLPLICKGRSGGSVKWLTEL